MTGNIPLYNFFKDFIYSFLDRGEEKEKEREEISVYGCLSSILFWGPGPQPRHVPWLGIELVTLWFTACAQSTELHQSGLHCIIFKSIPIIGYLGCFQISAITKTVKA